MPNAWGGSDPTEVVDPADYELGCEYAAVADLTVTHIRVWAGAGEVAVAGRKGRIWSTAGGQLGIATLADDLPTGWSSYPLDVPVERLAGQHFVVSYSAGGNYGALVHGLDTAVDSADAAVTAVAGGAGAHGNGSFHGTPGTFPDTASSNNSFFGADAGYTLGIGGNTAPRITQAIVATAGAVATAVITAEDDETLAGAVYRYDWGDGSSVTSSGSATAQHTYAASGLYAVLMSVTDSDGLADAAAAPARIFISAAGSVIEEELAQLLADLGLGTYHADGTVGGTIYLITLPQTPDQALAVATYPGPESDSRLAHDHVAAQIRVRGDADDARTGKAAAQAVYDALHGLDNRTLPGGTRLVLMVATQSGPAYIGRDENRRHEWVVNVRAELRRPTAHRP